MRPSSTELARDSGRADTGSGAETVVARFDPATRISEGQNAEIWVDVRRLHVFDPSTGENLTLGDSGTHASAAPADTGGGAPAQADAGATGQDTGSTGSTAAPQP